jgi:hypothetical protein
VKIVRLILALALLGTGTAALATLFSSAPLEQVFVKYRGPVNLAPFDCEWVARSSLVNRVCYDKKEQYLIVNLSGTYYHYCEIPANVVSAWKQSDSMGRFYNARVKGNFDCRVNRMPAY